jgi:hypothetical protein
MKILHQYFHLYLLIFQYHCHHTENYFEEELENRHGVRSVLRKGRLLNVLSSFLTMPRAAGLHVT